jgi:transcriptional regulator with XRE-family HTH domain
VKNLLILLGKRVRELRVAKEWSQEEFAHVSGLHRTYIGQIERGEKNISFENLVKISSVLSVTASELLLAIDSDAEAAGARRVPPPRDHKSKSVHQAHEIQKLLTKLRHQRSALDRTLSVLEELMAASSQRSARSDKRRTRTG